MKPGLLDICVIILSLAMAVILAFDVVALRSRALVQLSEQDAGAKSANIALGCFASTEVAHSAVYHRMGDCHATQFSLQARWR